MGTRNRVSRQGREGLLRKPSRAPTGGREGACGEVMEAGVTSLGKGEVGGREKVGGGCDSPGRQDWMGPSIPKKCLVVLLQFIFF